MHRRAGRRAPRAGARARPAKITASASRFAYTSTIGARRRGERALDDRDHRGDAAAPRERDDRASRSCNTNSPVGRITSIAVARARACRSSSSTCARPATRLTVVVKRLADVGRARHRVAAHDRLAVDRRPEGAELPGACTRTSRPARRGRRGRTSGCRRSRRRPSATVERVVLVVGQHRRFPDRRARRDDNCTLATR